MEAGAELSGLEFALLPKLLARLGRFLGRGAARARTER
jgi:hypothetical protein